MSSTLQLITHFSLHQPEISHLLMRVATLSRHEMNAGELTPLTCTYQGLTPSMSSSWVSQESQKRPQSQLMYHVCALSTFDHIRDIQRKVRPCTCPNTQNWSMRCAEGKDSIAHRQHTLGCNRVCDPLWPQHRSGIPAASHAGVSGNNKERDVAVGLDV